MNLRRNFWKFYLLVYFWAYWSKWRASHAKKEKCSLRTQKYKKDVFSSSVHLLKDNIQHVAHQWYVVECLSCYFLSQRRTWRHFKLRIKVKKKWHHFIPVTDETIEHNLIMILDSVLHTGIIGKFVEIITIDKFCAFIIRITAITSLIQLQHSKLCNHCNKNRQQNMSPSNLPVNMFFVASWHTTSHDMLQTQLVQS